MEQQTELQDSQELEVEANETENDGTEVTPVEYSSLTEDDYNREVEARKKAEETNRQLFERAKKAEAELKKLKTPAERQEEKTLINAEQFITRDEAMLLNKGLSDEDISALKVIQAGLKVQGEDKKLVDLLENPLFVASREKREADIKREKAKLGASSGGQVEKQKPMTDEEHKEFAKKKAQELLSRM